MIVFLFVHEEDYTISYNKIISAIISAKLW